MVRNRLIAVLKRVQEFEAEAKVPKAASAVPKARATRPLALEAPTPKRALKTSLIDESCVQRLKSLGHSPVIHKTGNGTVVRCSVCKKHATAKRFEKLVAEGPYINLLPQDRSEI